MNGRSSRRRHIALVALAAALALSAGPAAAADGRIPIYEVPVTIDQPGSYYLTQDLTYGAAGESIIIAASDVTLDFAGHTLEQTSLGNYAVKLDGDYTNLVIRNGRLKGGNIGFFLRNTTGDDFSVRIEDMIVQDSLNQGIWVQGQSLVGSSQAYILRNVIHDTGDDGIYLRYMWGGLVADNVINDIGDSASDHGIYLNTCRGVTLTRNNVSHAFGDGIRVWYSWYIAVDWNHMTYNNDWGLNVFDGDQIVFSNNRAYGNGNGGFTIPGAEGHVNAGGNYPPP